MPIHYSLWTTYGSGNFYNFQIARDLAEFRTTQKRRFEPMGITQLSQIDELITNFTPTRLELIKIAADALNQRILIYINNNHIPEDMTPLYYNKKTDTIKIKFVGNYKLGHF